ncbi:MAG: PAS domain S-box protein [Phycisphaerales bacterium]|nr:MAG: PAS domain S-box protein [Phycisphaerales bacterium]
MLTRTSSRNRRLKNPPPAESPMEPIELLFVLLFLVVVSSIALYSYLRQLGRIRLLEREVEQLNVVRDRFELASRAARDAIWDYDVKNSKLHWRGDLLKDFGYEDVTTTDFHWWEDRVHEDDRDRVAGSVRTALESDADFWSCSYRFRRADGSFADVHDRGYILRNQDGQAHRFVGVIDDLTSQKEAEASLGLKEAQFQALTSSLPDPIARFDRQLRHLYVNPAMERVSGLSAEQVIGRTNRDLGLPGELVNLWDREISRVFETGDVNEFGFEIQSSGGPRYLVARVAPERRSDGTFDSVVSVVRDITDLQKAEQELEARERQYRLLFRSNPHPMFVFDVHTLEILEVNDAAVDQYGYSRDEFQTMTILDIRPEEDIPRLRDSHDPKLTGSKDAGHWRHHYKDGTVIEVEIYTHATEFRGRQAEIALAINITDRAEAERALRESEARFTAFMNNNPAAAWIKDEIGRYIYANRAALAVYQRTEEELGVLDDEKLFSVDVAKSLIQNDETVRRTREPLHTYETIDHPDGTRHIWMIVKFPLVLSQEVCHVGGFALDVTDRVQAEEELREYASALERSNRELEQFAYVASHDLQEPLRMVSSYTQLLASRYQDKLDKDANEFIGYAVEGATRMQQLIDDLLAYSRVQSHKQAFSPVDLNESLDAAIKNLAHPIQESGARIHHDPLPTVPADEVQMQQVLQNLISNAVKFRSRRTPDVHVSAREEEGEWIVSVSDNGIGLDPSYQDRIFVIFQRLHSRNRYPGTGIGLAICKRIVERHGGRIWVESTPDQGSTFSFSIPSGDRR